MPTSNHTTADLIAIVQQATQPLNENINQLRMNFTSVISNLINKDKDQQAEIDQLRVEVETGNETLDEICERMKTMEGSISSLLVSIPSIVELGILEKENDGLDKRLKKLESYIPFIRNMRWVAGILATLMIGTIWALITGMQSIIDITP